MKILEYYVENVIRVDVVNVKKTPLLLANVNVKLVTLKKIRNVNNVITVKADVNHVLV